MKARCPAWWHQPIVPTLRRLRQEDHCEFGASQDYMVRLSQNILWVSVWGGLAGKGALSKPDDLNPIPRVHKVKGESPLPQAVLWPSHTLTTLSCPTLKQPHRQLCHHDWQDLAYSWSSLGKTCLNSEAKERAGLLSFWKGSVYWVNRQRQKQAGSRAVWIGRGSATLCISPWASFRRFSESAHANKHRWNCRMMGTGLALTLQGALDSSSISQLMGSVTSAKKGLSFRWKIQTVWRNNQSTGKSRVLFWFFLISNYLIFLIWSIKNFVKLLKRISFLIIILHFALERIPCSTSNRNSEINIGVQPEN